MVRMKIDTAKKRFIGFIFVTLTKLPNSDMRLLSLFASFFLLCIATLHGQIVLKTGQDTATPQKKDVKVNIINPHGKQPVRYDGKSMHTDSVQQAFKLNAFQLVRGEFTVYFEYRLSDAFSAEAGAGVTYIDYPYELFNNEGRFLFKDGGEGKNVRFLSGFAGHAQVRWYPSRYETAITGFYLAPEISRRNWQMDYLVNTGLIREPHRMKRTWTDFKIHLGYQTADPYENIFWEWFFSAGIRINEEDRVNGIAYGAEFTHEKYARFVVGGGIKIGFTL